MPTLDDAPTVTALATANLLTTNTDDSSKIATQDLIQVYDVSEQVAKTITVADLANAIQTTDDPVTATT